MCFLLMILTGVLAEILSMFVVKMTKMQNYLTQENNAIGFLGENIVHIGIKFGCNPVNF